MLKQGMGSEVKVSSHGERRFGAGASSNQVVEGRRTQPLYEEREFIAMG